MKGIFGEDAAKFRMHTGDILIVEGKNPFSIDLPMDIRVPEAKMFSWCIVTAETDSIELVPRVLDFIEDIIHDSEEAMKYYGEEMKEIERTDLKSAFHVEKEAMERLRVTPRLYARSDIRSRVLKSKRIFNIRELSVGAREEESSDNGSAAANEQSSESDDGEE